MNEGLHSTVLNGFQQGKESSFRVVFNQYYRAVYYFTYKLTSSEAEAGDIALYVFQKLFERCKLFETETNIKAFLFISARNKSLDYLKAQKRQEDLQKEMAREMSNDTLLRYEYEIMDELVDKLKAAIENLPEKNREIFKLLYYEQMTPEEIAALLRISVQTVYTHRTRAIESLRILVRGKSLSLSWLLIICNCLHEHVSN
jgi:RNA polymerase sigma-70 factor (ECF subfamily)